MVILNIVLALLALSVIVIIHEFGHFLLAKLNGVGVTEFAVGMGPIILQTKKGETVYCIKLLPFGGSCMMVGEDEDCEDDKAFNNKPVWARISVIAAGPIFNFILAFILAVIIIANVGYDPCVIYSVEEGSVAYEAGLRAEDVIVSINGSAAHFSRDYTINEIANPEKTLNIVYERNGERYSTIIVPRFVEHYNYQMGINITGLEITGVVENMPATEAGILAGDIIEKVNNIEVSTAEEAVELILGSNGANINLECKREDETVVFDIVPKQVHQSGYETGLTVLNYREDAKGLQIITLGYHETIYWIKTVFVSLRMLFTGRVSANEVSGPVGVVSMIGDVVEESKIDGLFYVFINLFNMSCMISANLGVMNLLPLPALDGGRLVFLLIEAVRGKGLNRKTEGFVHFAGLILLMVLMVIITFKDIIGLFK